MEKPTFIDLPNDESRASSAASSRHGYSSPRHQHFDGDVPPTLSPLDAFAAHSRRLAKELEETRKAGERHMNRLLPVQITKSLNQHQANRPACFRSLSSEPTDVVTPLPPKAQSGPGSNPRLTEPFERPVSTYPHLSGLRLEDDDSNEEFKTPRESFTTHDGSEPATLMDYFNVARTSSPIRYAESPRPIDEHSSASSVRKSTDLKSYGSQHNPFHGLAPPNAAFARTKPYQESSDDDNTSSNAGSTFSRPRRPSASSGISAPVSPALNHHDRTPSNASNLSLSSQTRSRSRLNFSRPMSQSSLSLKVDSPIKSGRGLERKPSHLSDNSHGLTSFEDDRSILSEVFITGESASHQTFTLPRGRNSDHISQVFNVLSTSDSVLQEPLFSRTIPLSANRVSQSPIASHARPSQDTGSSRSETGDFSFDFGRDGRQSNDKSRRPSITHTTGEYPQPLAGTVHPATPPNFTSYDPSKMPVLPPIPGSTADDHSARTRSERSESTVRPTTSRSVTNYQAYSADDHVDKAIDLHQDGHLKESTYHLRIAARQDHPTGMLLYALACRHGWGMRANPAEGVAWLRKAVDTAMLEVAHDETPESRRSKVDVAEKKSHRTQFGMAVYELGVSHLNGWGVEQDKPLALRCFEIAGSWGDADALTEAGFCYAEGIGSKKDLKKAAKFYRMAEAKGVSMVGNSWIYKDKYNDDADNDKKKGRTGRSRKASYAGEDKKLRSKSKTRSIFGRRKHSTAGAEQVSTSATASPVKS